MKKYCPSCNKKIGIGARILFSKKCSKCQKECHKKCTIQILDANYFLRDSVKQESVCLNCARINSENIGKERFCTNCGRDISNITFGVHGKICDSCSRLMCKHCMHQTEIAERVSLENDFNKYMLCHKCDKINKEILNENPEIKEVIEIYANAFEEGHRIGYQKGYQEGYSSGHSDGYSSGYNNGYSDGERDNR